jgi:hypothetical protein
VVKEGLEAGGKVTAEHRPVCFAFDVGLVTHPAML